MRRSRDFDKVAPRTRLAAGEMNLQYAEGSRLAEDPGPSLRIELVGARIKCNRVGAIRTAKRAAMRQLGEKTERTMQWSTPSPVYRVGIRCSICWVVSVFSHWSEFQQPAVGESP